MFKTLLSAPYIISNFRSRLNTDRYLSMKFIKQSLLALTASLFLLASCSSKSSDSNTNGESAEKATPLDTKALLAYNPKNADKRIDEVIQNLHKTRGFNGNVLVAKHGKIIYEK